MTMNDVAQKFKEIVKEYPVEMKLRSERFTLRNEPFKDVILRRWNFDDDTYEYHILCNISRAGDERWQRLNLSNGTVEEHIRLYSINKI